MILKWRGGGEYGPIIWWIYLLYQIREVGKSFFCYHGIDYVNDDTFFILFFSTVRNNRK